MFCDDSELPCQSLMGPFPKIEKHCCISCMWSIIAIQAAYSRLHLLHAVRVGMGELRRRWRTTTTTMMEETEVGVGCYCQCAREGCTRGYESAATTVAAGWLWALGCYLLSTERLVLRQNWFNLYRTKKLFLLRVNVVGAAPSFYGCATTSKTIVALKSHPMTTTMK